MTASKYIRPALAIIAEGDGEFRCLPGLAKRIAPTVNFVTPLNARGHGNITAASKLERLIRDTVIVHKPVSILCALDLTDIVPKHYATCAEVVEDLTSRYSTWADTEGQSPKYSPPPLRFAPVVQCKALETWICADPAALIKLAGFTPELADVRWTNVDEELANPQVWLREKSGGTFDSKDPSQARSALSNASIETLEASSRSFRKFAKEVRAAAAEWDSLPEPPTVSA